LANADCRMPNAETRMTANLEFAPGGRYGLSRCHQPLIKTPVDEVLFDRCGAAAAGWSSPSSTTCSRANRTRCTTCCRKRFRRPDDGAPPPVRVAARPDPHARLARAAHLLRLSRLLRPLARWQPDRANRRPPARASSRSSSRSSSSKRRRSAFQKQRSRSMKPLHLSRSTLSILVTSR